MTGSAKTNPLVVLHLMRTYGAHGGENQLARYFSTEPQGGIEEHFAFIYRDPDCTALFQRAGARLTRHELIPFAVAPRQSAWAEVLMLLPLLPFLQLRFAASAASDATQRLRRARHPGRACRMADGDAVEAPDRLSLCPPHNEIDGTQ